MTKSDLRKIYLAKQKDLSPAERAEKSQKISDRFFQSIDLDPIRFLHCFIAIDKFNEIDTTVIFQRLWRDFSQVTTLVPRVNFESGEIENLLFTPGTELVRNVWEIHEPAHDEYGETPLIDMVLAPLLCFDRRGYRVGYGKGFYDKFLSKCRPDCLKIGLGYFPPVREIVDTGDHDVKLDLFVTPDKTYPGEA
jgi:5-formyltetrahydrofolate cyclo-ligase